MSIEFLIHNAILIMRYSPDFGSNNIRQRLDTNEEIRLKNSFYLKAKNEYIIEGQDDEVNEETFLFNIGDLVDNYYRLDKEIFSTKNNFYISKEIKILPKLLIANRNISILKKIDNLVNHDVYITTDETEYKPGYLPYTAFLDLIYMFPNSTELTKYTNSRIALILKNYFDDLGDVGPAYERYLNRRSNKEVRVNSTTSMLRPLQLSLFQGAYEIMQEMLKRADAYSEQHWQETVCEIVRMIYPKYILAKREQFEGDDGRHRKKPDFLLIDSGGFVDVLEIKKPNNQRLMTKTEYRNNYVADRDLSGAIVQIEKYVLCLNHGGKSIEQKFQRNLQSELPTGIKIRIAGPQGMLLMGRSKGLSEEQLFDLEIIKRQHKNVIDIMTYDDLMDRIENIIKQLSHS
jgi:hypothetical protein